MPAELYNNGFIYIAYQRPTWGASNPVSPREVIPLQTGGQNRFFRRDLGQTYERKHHYNE